MSFFSIDCSTEIASLFLKVKNKTFIKVLQSHKSNNDLLMKKILDFFNENKLSFDDITKIYINQGPGNYSGLRTSLSIAKGICISKNLNLYGYDNFIWTSVSFSNKKKNILSIFNLRKKYFLKRFNSNLENISEVEEINHIEKLKKYNEDFIVIDKNQSKHFDKNILRLDNLFMVDLDHKVLELLQKKGLLNESLIRPLYLS